jgi:hypothetical protein
MVGHITFAAIRMWRHGSSIWLFGVFISELHLRCSDRSHWMLRLYQTSDASEQSISDVTLIRRLRRSNAGSPVLIFPCKQYPVPDIATTSIGDHILKRTDFSTNTMLESNLNVLKVGPVQASTATVCQVSRTPCLHMFHFQSVSAA